MADSTFDQHAKDDVAIADPRPSRTNREMSFIAKLTLFLGFPVTVGTLGLYFAWLESRRNLEKNMEFGRDFIMPFLLSLAMAIVMFVQTNGFTSDKFQPLVHWPKVRRVKKIVRKPAQAKKED